MHWIDPTSLAKVEGRIACFTRNMKGEVDGVLLGDDRQIHLPPHLGTRFEKLFAPGEPIEARCVKPRGGDVFAAVSVSNAAGKTLVDDGPPHKHGEPHRKGEGRHAPGGDPHTAPIDIDGRVRRTLFAPKGEVAGAVLESGEQLRVDPKANAELACYFEKGAAIRAWGRSLKRKGTTVVVVEEIGFSKDFA